MKKNLQLIINIILGVAVIVLFILQFCGGSSCGSEQCGTVVKKSKDSTKVGSTTVNIAYVNTDSLLLNYTFAKEANEKLLSRSERSRSELQKRMEEWQKDGMEFQKKLEANAFLSRERAEAEQNRLLKKRQELEELDSRLTRELMEEQAKMNEQLRDSVVSFLKEYNKTKAFQVIFSNTMNDNVLYAEEGYDITNEVVEMLNARCKKEKK